ncbi:MAG TPA: lipid-A-disaccharide synthase [Pirellulales bacterium]|jgi:lipid-A-disaccharide synthase|nr:lipid-A-disaccharide synthase [Pirellulales bacterium]
MKIFFSAGEPSGDLHGANLVRQLRAQRSDVECVGYGGPLMAAAGCELHADLTALAVMFLLRAILHLPEFLALAGRADRYFRHHRPDAVVLIDYPGFNWWIAKRAKAHGIPVYYFAPPQIWAWAQHRVKKMRRLVDHVLCGLAFEAEWFRAHGCNATLVGHPFFDEVRRQQLDQNFLSEARARHPGRRLVAILPGSRTQEVTNNLEQFLKAAAIVRARVPDVWFAVAAFKSQHAEFARQRIAESGLPIEVCVGRTPELIHLSECCMAVSGSVSLELLFQKKPTVIQYRIGRIGFQLQKAFRKSKYITLVNLLAAKDPLGSATGSKSAATADRPLFPEFLSCEDCSLAVAAQLIRWLLDAEQREGLVAELAKLKARVAHGGATQAAAAYILKTLVRPIAPPRPHFQPGMAVASSGGAEAATAGSESPAQSSTAPAADMPRAA